MEKARLLVSFNFFLLYIAAAGAFSPVAKSKNGRISTTSALCSSEDDRGDVKMPRRSDFLALLGTVVTGSIVSSVAPAQAAITANPCKLVVEQDPNESNHQS